jgi:hypothetical protein
MPLTSWDFFDEERHHQQVAALHRPPPSAGGTGTGTGLYHDYQHHHPHNSHQSASRNSLWNNRSETLQSGGQDSLLGVTLLDFERFYRSQVVSRRLSLQHFMQFPAGEPSNSSDQSLQQASPETLISEVLEDIESLFDDDEQAPSSQQQGQQRAQVAAPRRPGAVNQSQQQQQTRHYVNPSTPASFLQTWQREPAISGMVATRDLPSSLLVPTKMGTVSRTNTQQGHHHQQEAVAGKKCLKRTGFEFNNCSPSSNARADGAAFPITKKPRGRYCTPAVDENKSEGESMSEDRRFRSYQAEQWAETFTELCDFRKEKGHCQVPHCYPKNPSLARWVKRQRYQHKLKTEGKPSTMTDERIGQLEKIGFIWDSHSSAWEERFNELRVFRERAGHCNVPSNFPDNPPLATWVKCQRRQYKLFWQGKTSNINLHRIEQLHEVGFEWVLRGPGKTSSQQF